MLPIPDDPTLDDLDAAVAAFADAKITTTHVLTNVIALYNKGTAVNSSNLTTLVAHFNDMTAQSDTVRIMMSRMKKKHRAITMAANPGAATLAVCPAVAMR